MLEEAESNRGADRRDRRPKRLGQSLAGADSGLSQQTLDLRQRLPTFICVIWMHILDDAQGAEDGLRMPAARRWLSRNRPSAPPEAPTAYRDRRREVAS